MHLDSNKTGVLLWCTLLLVFSFQSPSEATGSPSGLESTVDQVTVDGVEPWEPFSRNVLKQSSDSAANRVTGPLLGRHLVQRPSSSSAVEDGDVCELTLSQRRRYYTDSSRTWTVTDEVLEELDNDVQSIVNCAAPEDTILFSTRKTIQPRRSIVISTSLTLTSQPEEPLIRDGIIPEVERKVKLRCPTSGNLLTIRNGSVLLSNLIFRDCNGTSNVVSVETTCDDSSRRKIIQFHYLEFKSLILAGENRILEVVQPTCADFWLENVIIRDNQCGREICFALSVNNTLTNIQVAGNRAADINATKMTQVFALPTDSQTIATNISASANAIRQFNVVNGTFTLRASHFEGNGAHVMETDNSTSVRGSVMVFNASTIIIEDSILVNNSGWTGGAVYAVASDLDIRSCTFRENDSADYGGALYSINASSLTISSCTFSKNNAIHGAGIFSYQSSSFQVMNSRFWENNGTRGAGLYVVHGNMRVESCEFLKNNASSVGGGLVAVRLNGSMRNLTFSRNNATWGGALAVQTYSTVRTNGLQFVGNHARMCGGAVYEANSTLAMRNASLGKNRALDDGSALCVRDGALSLRDVNVTDNFADHYGTMFMKDSSGLFRRVLVRRNVVDWSGGGFYCDNSSITIGHSRFENNAAAWGGGGLRFSDCNITIRQSRFENNSVRDRGGAIDSSWSRLQVSLTLFPNNTSGDYGGGIYALRSDVALNKTNFTNNTGDYGGGCYFSDGNGTLHDVHFSRNWASDGSGGGFYISEGRLIGDSIIFQENQARKSGGGMCALDLLALDLSRTHFHNNIANHGGGILATRLLNASLSTARFENNIASKSGGGIYVDDSMAMFLVEVHLQNNTGAYCGAGYLGNVSSTAQGIVVLKNRAIGGSGGGICLNAGTFSGDSLTFQENHASESGGGINAGDLLDLSLTAVRFEKNTGEYGGGGFFSNVSATMQRSIFSRNRAIDGSGGGIYLENGRLNGQSLTYRENRASNWGGGIYASDLVALHLSDVRFHRNVGYRGGAIGIYNTTLNISRSCIFSGNNATWNGGSIYHKLSQSTVSSCLFEYDTARYGGSLYIDGISKSNISNCVFRNSMALWSGGGIEVTNNTRVFISKSSFSKCGAYSRGGAVRLELRSNLTVSSCRFRRNRIWYGHSIRMSCNVLNRRGESTSSWFVASGGAICAQRGSVTIKTSTFHRNNVSEGAGGALCFDECNVTISDTRFLSNRAKNNGGVSAAGSSFLNVTNISMNSNVAVESGGGMGTASGASLLCTRCEFRNNNATWGGGMAAYADDSILIVAQLQDSTFVNNTALSFGGGMLFRRPMNTTIDCSAPNKTCGRVVLLNTTFANNIANSSGSAILTTDPEGVLVSCKHKKPQYDIMDSYRLGLLDVVHPTRVCGSWRRNRLAMDAPGDVIGTYGRVLSFSTKSANEVQIIGDLESGFVLENVVSGKQLPVINVTVLDAYGNGPLPTDPHTLEATMTSPDGFFQGTYPTNITGGAGNFSNVVGFTRPGNYTLRVFPNTYMLDIAEILIQVRECRVGEEPTTNGELCQDCDAVSYNFDPQKVGGCTLCPTNSNCDGRFIIPKDGYWHKGPCHPNIKECLSEEACAYKHRQEKIKNYSVNHLDCDFNESVLTDYSEVLCREGYEGPLCGSCSESYGLSTGFKCSKCPHVSGAILTLTSVTLLLLAISSFTIRGGLPLKLKTFRASIPSTSASESEAIEAQERDVGVNLQKVQVMVEGKGPSSYFRAKQEPSTSTAPPHTSKSNDLELTKWITAEIFKVMINFLQVTTVAASINVQWTEGILVMFVASECLGALTTAAISRPIDCIVSSCSAIARSIWRMLVNLFVPGVVMSIFAGLWGFITFRESKALSYFWKRLTLSAVAVTYISYLGLTKLAVRVFYCVDVSNNELQGSHIRYLALDTSIKCYEKGHFSLIVIAVVILVLVSLSFPLFIAVMLFRHNVQSLQTNGWTHETVGVLFRAFKKEFVFWESLIMFRKACLSVIVVFSYPLGGHAQGLLALVVLLLCLYLQQACSPYKKEFHKLNYYEAGSLLVSCLTFILGQFFNVEQCSTSTITLVEVTIILLNTAFFTFLLIVLFLSGVNHLRVVLKYEYILVDDNARWWVVLKLFMKSKMPKPSRSKQ